MHGLLRLFFGQMIFGLTSDFFAFLMINLNEPYDIRIIFAYFLVISAELKAEREESNCQVLMNLPYALGFLLL